MPHKEYCIDVPDVFNGTAVHNNSRWAFVAEPAGTVPAGGWPVLINLAIIDFKPELGSMVKNRGQCGLDGDIPGGHHGFRRRRLQRGGMTEEFQPFATPDEIMEPCTCFAPNGTYTCKTSADNGHHMAPGAGCSFDILAGGMWFQRQKQYLLANGIAVVVVNARTFDGWNIDNETYDGHRPPSPGANPYESVTEGTDKPFFAALARDMASGKLGLLNPERVAFHGWSGGAQMVSELVDVHARGELTGMTMKAGVMMSGGTQQVPDSCFRFRSYSEDRSYRYWMWVAVLQHAARNAGARARLPRGVGAVRRVRRRLRLQHPRLLRAPRPTPAPPSARVRGGPGQGLRRRQAARLLGLRRVPEGELRPPAAARRVSWCCRRPRSPAAATAAHHFVGLGERRGEGGGGGTMMIVDGGCVAWQVLSHGRRGLLLRQEARHAVLQLL
jgi:hypothetical protein